MKKIIYILGISAIILSAICFANAQTQKFDVMTYTAPKGWTAGQNGTAKTFTTIDKAAGKFCIMLLYPSVTNHGTPSQDFAIVWKTLVQDTFNAGGNPDKETTQADGFTMIAGGELIDYEGTKALAMLTTVSGKGRVISLLSIMNDAKYADNVQAFLGGMDIDIKETPKQVSPQNPIQKPTKRSSGNSSSLLTDSEIAGVWTCYRMTIGSSNLSWYYKVFFSNGKSLDVMPRKGLLEYDPASEVNLSVGRYTFGNGKGSNFKSDQARVSDKLTLNKPNELEIDSHKYMRAVDISGGKLNGSFTSISSSSIASLQTMPYGEKPLITFSKDGRFNDEGLFNTLLFDKGTNPAAAKPGSGTYELQDYTIILNYDDGRVRQEAFVFAWSGTLETGRIVLMNNGAQLNKIQ
jgi:hypothetical protein